MVLNSLIKHMLHTFRQKYSSVFKWINETALTTLLGKINNFNCDYKYLGIIGGYYLMNYIDDKIVEDIIGAY